MNVGMFESFVTRGWFSAEARALWSDRATLQAWLDVEAALASAQAGLGLIPAAAAERIGTQARAEHFDLDPLAEAIAFAQHPLVPVLHRLEALCGEPAAGFLHWGVTTQNIFDTAAALQMGRTQALIARDLDAAIEALADLAQRHEATVMAGRTHGQQALPMTLGFKLAGWIDELDRHRTRLAERLAASFPACMGGAIGTHAATGAAGREVERRLAARLGLQPAGLASRASYDRAADYIATLGLLAGTAQRLAQDVVLMQRTEIGELAERFHPGKVGSSTLAHKRNPSTALRLASLARLARARVPTALEAMVRMDEGDSAATNVADTLLPEVAVLAASIAETLRRLAQGLVVDAEAMRRNLAISRGLIVSEAVMMRLGPVIGRHAAHRLLYEAAGRVASDGLSFAEAIRTHPALPATEATGDWLRALDPQAYVGESVALTRETLARTAGRDSAGPPVAGAATEAPARSATGTKRMP
jgi:adenylosuccinate lyase/3-carboxy-cis,cis-muconate cycloisomerase